MPEPPKLPVIGTDLAVTSYEHLSLYLFGRASEPKPYAVDFTNTQIVTMRRHEESFRSMTSVMDLFVPDGMPLIWCLNRQGAKLTDRVYGPAFFRYCLTHSPKEIRHFFLGASNDCLEKLEQNIAGWNSNITICGRHHGYFSSDEEEEVLEAIHAAKPDIIWVGLGTPKQQAWIERWKSSFDRGILLAVGFAFDVNAGTKKDAPLWMQRIGLTWLFRLCSEPRRLFGRYLKWNSLFLWYLVTDGLGEKKPNH